MREKVKIINIFAEIRFWQQINTPIGPLHGVEHHAYAFFLHVGDVGAWRFPFFLASLQCHGTKNGQRLNRVRMHDTKFRCLNADEGKISPATPVLNRTNIKNFSQTQCAGRDQNRAKGKNGPAKRFRLAKFRCNTRITPESSQN